MRRVLLTDWNFFRMARLLLGLGALVQAILLREWMLAFAGLLIAGMALANTGCGIRGCATPSTGRGTKAFQNTEEIQYEEVDIKK